MLFALYTILILKNFHVLHHNVALLMGRHSEHGARNIEQKLFRNCLDILNTFIVCPKDKFLRTMTK